MLPIFEAVDVMADDGLQPLLQWTSVDIITDRNNLLKRAGWADSGCSSTRSKKGFRIDVEWVGSRAILLQRWEERTTVWSNGGFGDSFERASSLPAPGCEDSTLVGSSRIITYVRWICIFLLNHSSNVFLTVYSLGLFWFKTHRPMRR